MVIAARDAEIKPGYKLTEVGVIPEDWEVKSIGDLVTFSGGSQPPRSTFKFQKRDGYIRLIQIRDYKTDEFETYIPEELARKKCTANDIMIGRYGPPIFQILRGIEGAYNVALLKAIPSPHINREYLYQFLRQDSLFQYVESLSQRSSGQTGIEMPALKNYPFPFPPLPEQRAIATALSDVDALIASFDKLIAKKRDIKQATMQQLFTGKTRLPGFGGEWKIKKLGEIVSINMGQSPDSKNYNSKGIGIPLIQGNADIDNRKSVSRVWTTQITKTCNVGDLIMTVRAPVGSIAIASKASCLGRGVCSLKPIRDNNHFIFHLMTLFEEKWKVLEQGSTFTSANSSQIAEFPLSIVDSIEEQTAIATVLSDMDAEIVALEQRRYKTRALKQGMMQELLTGKTRLI